MSHKGFKQKRKEQSERFGPAYFMGGPVYGFIYIEQYDLIIMQDNLGFLLSKHDAKEIIEELEKYIDEFPQELIDYGNAHAEEMNEPS